MKSLFALLLLTLFSSNSINSQPAYTSIHSHDSTRTKKITLLFAGDLMQHQAQIDAARIGNGYDYSDCFKYVKNEIEKADVAIGNLEVTLGGKPYSGYPNFSAPDEFLAAIKEAGFDIMLTANNHCLDKGKKGLERTITMLDSLSINYLGTYKDQNERASKYPYILKQNGFKIAILNYTYGTNGIEARHPNIVNYIQKDIIEQDINNALKHQPDAIIACMHWGAEYIHQPSKSQSDLANWLLSKGVTHIIGSHPHVLQPMELRHDTINNIKNVIIYSQGNFISNMSKRATDGGAFIKLTLEKDSTTRVANCEYSLVWTGRPIITGNKNFVLYPINISPDSLNDNSRNKLSIFAEDSRKLLNEKNIEIKEYFFQ